MKMPSLGALLAVAVFAFSALASADEVVVYSTREEHLIKPIFDAYTKDTGVKIKLVTDVENSQMQRRLKVEGKDTLADMLLTVDAGNLWEAAREGLLRPVQSKVLSAHIPAHLRDPGNQWFGLSVRARTIFYNTRKVRPAELSTYEDLGSQKWKNRLCLRTSKKIYNQSLVAMMIAEHGEAKAEQIVKSWVANLASAPFPNDTDMLEAIASGQCDVGIANTYYFGRLMKKKPGLPIGIFWPDKNGKGVHVNISGAGITKYAKHEKEAIKLLEWLSSKKAQDMLADVNLEYPANPAVKCDPVVAAWGSFRHNQINVAKAGELQAAAVRLMDRAGYK